jgi:hypothetical protein
MMASATEPFEAIDRQDTEAVRRLIDEEPELAATRDQEWVFGADACDLPAEPRVVRDDLQPRFQGDDFPTTPIGEGGAKSDHHGGATWSCHSQSRSRGSELVAEALGWRGTTGRPWLLDAAALSFATTTLSLARFGHSVLLPAMRDDLRWSYIQAEGMNTANALDVWAGRWRRGSCSRAWASIEPSWWRSSSAELRSFCPRSRRATSPPIPARRCRSNCSDPVHIGRDCSPRDWPSRALRLKPCSRCISLVSAPGILVSAFFAPTALLIEGGWCIG